MIAWVSVLSPALALCPYLYMDLNAFCTTSATVATTITSPTSAIHRVRG